MMTNSTKGASAALDIIGDQIEAFKWTRRIDIVAVREPALGEPDTRIGFTEDSNDYVFLRQAVLTALRLRQESAKSELVRIERARPLLDKE